MQSRIAQTARGPIEYTLMGSGPVVLACHGTSSNCFSMDGYAPLLRAGFSVLTPSRPGYGRTPVRVGASAVQAAEALVALLNCLEIEACAVMAISGGGPTGISLAARSPERVKRLALVAAISRPEERPNEAGYADQLTFYGPLHGLIWGSLGLMSRLSPQQIARQTMALFSHHDPQDTLRQLTADDIQSIGAFYRRSSSRRGALNDLTHTVGEELLQAVRVPTLIIHSRDDKSVPFHHARWALQYIPQAQLCESGITGHFYWVGPDYHQVSQRLADFLMGS